MGSQNDENHAHFLKSFWSATVANLPLWGLGVSLNMLLLVPMYAYELSDVYLQILRLIVCSTACIVTIHEYRKNHKSQACIAGIIALLFIPIPSITPEFEAEVWVIVCLITAALGFIYLKKNAVKWLHIATTLLPILLWSFIVFVCHVVETIQMHGEKIDAIKQKDEQSQNAPTERRRIMRLSDLEAELETEANRER